MLNPSKSSSSHELPDNDKARGLYGQPEVKCAAGK
jgi:hypothetical protein